MSLFGKLLPMSNKCQGDMKILRYGKSQFPLQVDLTRGVVLEVFAANNIGDALLGIDTDGGKLVGP